MAMNHRIRLPRMLRENRVPIPMAVMVRPMVMENCVMLSPSRYEEMLPISSS